jgi:hypothetical protein
MPMTGKYLVYTLLFLAVGLSGSVGADGLDDKIRAAGSDVKVFCPATDAGHIQWTALLYLNQTYGVEIYVAVFKPTPLFGCQVKFTPDGQFHLALIGQGINMNDESLADSTLACLFDGEYPNLAIFEAETTEDSLFLSNLLTRIREKSPNDAAAQSSLEKIYLRWSQDEGTAVLLNDEELYREYLEKAEEISKSFAINGPLEYKPERFRRYCLISPSSPGKTASNDFLFRSGVEPFGLTGIIDRRLESGPEKKNVMRRLDGYLSAITTARRPWLSKSKKLNLLLSAYAEISTLEEVAESASSQLSEAGVAKHIGAMKQKVFLAIKEALGIIWQGNIQVRETPFGKTSKLSLDLDLTGPRKIGLSYFKLHPSEGDAIVIDSIAVTILPHQRFMREYPVDMSGLDFTGQSGDSVLFSIDVIVDDLTLSLFVPFTDYADENVSLRFLPGYTFLVPFTEDQYTSLVQPFDWQLQITKPYGSELDGSIKINNPDGIVVGTFDDHILMPVGMTSKYFDIHFAAGRSIGFDVKRIEADLEVGGQKVAETGAEVGVVRCRIPETRDIAFAPDDEGHLEDFLRIAGVSFQPFTPRSMIRAPLEAYDLLVISVEAERFYGVLDKVSDRLHEFVRDGGDILILGQEFDWPHDIFSIPIYTSRTVSSSPGKVLDKSHQILNQPYAIITDRLLGRVHETAVVYPAIIGGGTEIVSAGEHGSYLTVFKIGEGNVIYCGLPLLEMAAWLDVEAIHLMANIINFGHGN